MAFVPSIGDVLVAIQLINDVYQKTVNAPAELQAAVKDVRDMKAELESMRSKVGDENSFVKRNGGAMLATITDTFKPLKEDLSDMRSLVRKYNKIPPFSPQKIIFGYFKIPDVKKIQENFNNYRAIYSRAFEHVGAEADAQNAAELKAINNKLENKNKQLASDINALKKQQQEAAKVQKDNNAKMDKVLSLLEQMKTPTTRGSPSLPVLKADLEKKLLDSGLKSEEVKLVMGPMIFASQDSQRKIPKIIVGPSGTGRADDKDQGQIYTNKSQGTINKLKALEPPVKAPGRSHSVSGQRDTNKDKSLPGRRGSLALSSKDEGSKRASSVPAVPKPNTPVVPNKLTIPAVNMGVRKAPQPPIQKRKDPERVNILCVDRTGGFHSALAQTYLELLRLWTANSSDPKSPRIKWLFGRISTRDLTISTDLTAHPSLSPSIALSSPSINTRISPMKAINALTAPPGYFRSPDYPSEKSTLVSRIETQLKTPSGLSKLDLALSDYIICFDPSVKNDLYRLQAIVDEKDVNNSNPKTDPTSPVKAKAIIIYLTNTSWYIPSKHTSAPELDEFITNMRTSIKSFATQHLHWERPNCVFENGSFRTIQLTVPQEQREIISTAVGTWVKDMRKAVIGVKEMKGVAVSLAFDEMGIGKAKKCIVWMTIPREKTKIAAGWVMGLLSTK